MGIDQMPNFKTITQSFTQYFSYFCSTYLSLSLNIFHTFVQNISVFHSIFFILLFNISQTFNQYISDFCSKYLSLSLSIFQIKVSRVPNCELPSFSSFYTISILVYLNIGIKTSHQKFKKI